MDLNFKTIENPIELANQLISEYNNDSVCIYRSAYKTENLLFLIK